MLHDTTKREGQTFHDIGSLFFPPAISGNNEHGTIGRSRVGWSADKFLCDVNGLSFQSYQNSDIKLPS